MILLAKVKFDLRDPDELYFAQKEADALFNTKTKLIKTIALLFKKRPFNLLHEEVVHLINRLVYLGEGQGFLTDIPPANILNAVKRATFFREIYIIFEAENEVSIINTVRKIGLLIKESDLTNKKIEPNPFTQVFIQDILRYGFKLVTIRFLPFHTLFEYVTEVIKLPGVVFRPKNNEDWESYFKEKETGIEKGVQDLLEHLKSGYYRCPHFGLGKNHIGDFVDWASTDLRKPFLHYLHKYKGKGDPRISRALINLLKVEEGDTILDPFVGSGAFIADAPTMGINAIGLEILNIGKMIAEVKCSLGINIKKLHNSIVKLFEGIETFSNQDIKDELTELKEKIRENTSDSSAYRKVEPHLTKILFLKRAIEKIENNEIRKFLLVLLSQQVVEYAEKNRTWDIISSFKSYVEDRYLVLFSTQKLAEILGVNINSSKIKIVKGDSTNMSMLKDSSIDGILTSPPYFDALDYIGNNRIPILILGLDEDLRWESTRDFYEAKYRDETKHDFLPLFVSDKYFSIDLPSSSVNLIEMLQKSRRIYKAKVVENYLKMMKLSFEECFRVLKKDKYYLMVISKYHSWIIDGKEELIETSSILADLGKVSGFKLVDTIEHGLSKADKGKIGVEDILIFQKVK